MAAKNGAAAHIMSKARAGLILDNPFFGALALKLAVVESYEIKTMATDGKRLLYNPKWTAKLPLPQVKGVIAHEVMHCAVLHHLRRGSRDHGKWNQACDYAINLILGDASFELPPGALINHAFRDMTADAIYTLLAQQEDEKGQGDGQGQGGQGQESQPGGGTDPGQLDVPGEVWDGASDGGSKEEAEADWKVAVTQAANMAKKQGKLPGSLERLVQQALSPKLDWREILQRFVTEKIKQDYSWQRPNRRFISQGFYLPSLDGQTVGNIVVGVDTSGSVSKEEVEAFFAEFSSILEEWDCRVYVVYCDTRVTNVEVFTKDDMPLDVHPRGGGGTDFRPVFDWVAKEDVEPAALVYFTDMECNRWPDPPHYPVLWANSGSINAEAPFGEVIQIEV